MGCCRENLTFNGGLVRVTKWLQVGLKEMGLPGATTQVRSTVLLSVVSRFVSSVDCQSSPAGFLVPALRLQ
jgi:hypothetical protein